MRNQSGLDRLVRIEIARLSIVRIADSHCSIVQIDQFGVVQIAAGHSGIVRIVAAHMADTQHVGRARTEVGSAVAFRLPCSGIR